MAAEWHLGRIAGRLLRWRPAGVFLGNGRIQTIAAMSSCQAGILCYHRAPQSDRLATRVSAWLGKAVATVAIW
jgi:hypothetical protein